MRGRESSMPNQVRQWPMWPSGDPACSSRARAARARAPALLNPPARVAMFAHARCEHFPPREPGKALIVAGLRRSDVQMTAITCEREATQRSAPHDHRHAYHNRFVLRGGMPSHLGLSIKSLNLTTKALNFNTNYQGPFSAPANSHMRFPDMRHFNGTNPAHPPSEPKKNFVPILFFASLRAV